MAQRRHLWLHVDGAYGALPAVRIRYATTAAASRAIDRALPQLKPTRSLRFALVSGGKDPDDVLREQGAEALRAQIVQTKSFVEALFERGAPTDADESKHRWSPIRRRCSTAPTCWSSG